jgi:hypothetical protein
MMIRQNHKELPESPYLHTMLGHYNISCQFTGAHSQYYANNQLNNLSLLSSLYYSKAGYNWGKGYGGVD